MECRGEIRAPPSKCEKTRGIFGPSSSRGAAVAGLSGLGRSLGLAQARGNGSPRPFSSRIDTSYHAELGNDPTEKAERKSPVTRASGEIRLLCGPRFNSKERSPQAVGIGERSSANGGETVRKWITGKEWQKWLFELGSTGLAELVG